MKKWKERWNAMLPHEKIFEMASWCAFTAFVIVWCIGLLQKCEILTLHFHAAVICRVLVTIVTACQAVVWWRKDRAWSYGFILACIVFGVRAVWDILRLCMT